MRIPDKLAVQLQENNKISMEATRNHKPSPDHRPVVHAKGRDPMNQTAEFYISEYDPWQDAYFTVVHDSSGTRAEWIGRDDFIMFAPVIVDEKFKASSTMREYYNTLRESV